MSTKTSVMRVQKDLKELAVSLGDRSSGPPMYAHPTDSLDRILALLIGPPGTPYDGGFFVFEIQVPQGYPNDPPSVRLLSTDSGSLRFNPNLYANGKVCLSILGTWPGDADGSESWRSSYTIGYVLQCIQCVVMNDSPYYNEPGFSLEYLSAPAMPYNAFGLSLLAAAESGPPSFEATFPAGATQSPVGPSQGASPVWLPNTADGTVSPQPADGHSPYATPPTAWSMLTGASGQMPVDVTLEDAEMHTDTFSAVVGDNDPVPPAKKDPEAKGSDLLPQHSRPGDGEQVLPPRPARGLSAPSLAVQPAAGDPQRLRAAVQAAAEAYRHKIHHETIRHAICDTLESILGLDRLVAASPAPPSSPTMGPDYHHHSTTSAATVFAAEIKRHFLMRYDGYLASVTTQKPRRPAFAALRAAYPGTRPAVLPEFSHDDLPEAPLDAPFPEGATFPRMPFEHKGNQICGSFQYTWLAARLERIYCALNDETDAWRRAGLEATAQHTLEAQGLLQDAALLAASATAGFSGGPLADNAFVWQITLLPSDGIYEGSAYTVDVVYCSTSSASQEPPRVRFRQPIHHPNISSRSGVPFIDISSSGESYASHSSTTAGRWSPVNLIPVLARLLQPGGMINRPPAILNIDAATAIFDTVHPDRHKEFIREARLAARRTVERTL